MRGWRTRVGRELLRRIGQDIDVKRSEADQVRSSAPAGCREGGMNLTVLPWFELYGYRNELLTDQIDRVHSAYEF